MKTSSYFTVAALTAALFATGVLAQTSNPTPTPAAPPAVVVSATPNEIIYLPRLPEPTELTNAASAQGITVQQIAQSSGQVTVIYRYADGQTHTVAYQLLPTAGSAPAAAPAAVTGIPAAPATVVYAAPAAVYPAPYYYYDPFYYPWPWFGPVSFRVGLGYSFHRFGGGYGFRHFGGGRGFHHR